MLNSLRNEKETIGLISGYKLPWLFGLNSNIVSLDFGELISCLPYPYPIPYPISYPISYPIQNAYKQTQNNQTTSTQMATTIVNNNNNNIFGTVFDQAAAHDQTGQTKFQRPSDLPLPESYVNDHETSSASTAEDEENEPMVVRPEEMAENANGILGRVNAYFAERTTTNPDTIGVLGGNIIPRESGMTTDTFIQTVVDTLTSCEVTSTSHVPLLVTGVTSPATLAASIFPALVAKGQLSAGETEAVEGTICYIGFDGVDAAALPGTHRVAAYPKEVEPADLDLNWVDEMMTSMGFKLVYDSIPYYIGDLTMKVNCVPNGEAAPTEVALTEVAPTEVAPKIYKTILRWEVLGKMQTDVNGISFRSPAGCYLIVDASRLIAPSTVKKISQDDEVKAIAMLANHYIANGGKVLFILSSAVDWLGKDNFTYAVSRLLQLYGAGDDVFERRPARQMTPAAISKYINSVMRPGVDHLVKMLYGSDLPAEQPQPGKIQMLSWLAEVVRTYLKPIAAPVKSLTTVLSRSIFNLVNTDQKKLAEVYQLLVKRWINTTYTAKSKNVDLITATINAVNALPNPKTTTAQSAKKAEMTQTHYELVLGAMALAFVELLQKVDFADEEKRGKHKIVIIIPSNISKDSVMPIIQLFNEAIAGGGDIEVDPVIFGSRNSQTSSMVICHLNEVSGLICLRTTTSATVYAVEATDAIMSSVFRLSNLRKALKSVDLRIVCNPTTRGVTLAQCHDMIIVDSFTNGEFGHLELPTLTDSMIGHVFNVFNVDMKVMIANCDGQPQLHLTSTKLNAEEEAKFGAEMADKSEMLQTQTVGVRRPRSESIKPIKLAPGDKRMVTNHDVRDGKACRVICIRECTMDGKQTQREIKVIFDDQEVEKPAQKKRKVTKNKKTESEKNEKAEASVLEKNEKIEAQVASVSPTSEAMDVDQASSHSQTSAHFPVQMQMQTPMQIIQTPMQPVQMEMLQMPIQMQKDVAATSSEPMTVSTMTASKVTASKVTASKVTASKVTKPTRVTSVNPPESDEEMEEEDDDATEEDDDETEDEDEDEIFN